MWNYAVHIFLFNFVFSFVISSSLCALLKSQCFIFSTKSDSGKQHLWIASRVSQTNSWVLRGTMPHTPSHRWCQGCRHRWVFLCWVLAKALSSSPWERMTQLPGYCHHRYLTCHLIFWKQTKVNFAFIWLKNGVWYTHTLNSLFKMKFFATRIF